MTYTAKYGFVTSDEGRVRRFSRGDPVDPHIARRLPDCVDTPVEQTTAAPGELRDTAFTCDHCGKVARSRAGLAAHIRSHEGVR